MSKIYKDENSDEWFFPDESYILSETNDKGIILYVNELFCEIAGYTVDELIGEPHNIVRHPDMPRIAFEGLWTDIQAKGFWTGIVKNIRRDRTFYWVHATVLRKINSNGEVTYLSVRRAPSRSDVAAAAKLYVELREVE